tara:strand:+ start:971 stop:1705 length:735 start_codon:yes stop_codon:yes gene_type:complete
MSIPFNRSIANVGPGSYDGRNDLGYVKTQNGGTGSEWNAGDALSSEVGPYDDRESRGKDLEDEEIDDLDVKFNKKIGSALQVQPNDSYAIKGTDPFYYADQYLNAGVNISGNLIESYIKEVILYEKLGISGNIAVASSPKGKNTGNKSKHYHIDNTTLGSMGGVHNGAYINHKGYKQPSNADKDGSRYMVSRNTELESINDDWEDSDGTTSGNLRKAFDQIEQDDLAVKKHYRYNKNKNLKSNI